jgi:hypothetical protein
MTAAVARARNVMPGLVPGILHVGGARQDSTNVLVIASVSEAIQGPGRKNGIASSASPPRNDDE